MDFLETRARVTELIGSAETAAAVAVHLSVQAGLVKAPLELAQRCTAVAEVVLGDTSELAPEQQLVLASMLRALLGQSAAFAATPDQPSTWAVTDPVVLQSLGQASAAFAPYICGPLAVGLGDLAHRLVAPGAAVLDVGVGVAALAVAFARLLPEARVVGLDVWEPSLAMARRNVEGAKLTDRVELRLQDVCELPEVDEYDLVWFSGPFIPGSVQPTALARCARALRPGGWLVYGAFGGRTPLAAALADLRTLRSGGPVLSDDQVVGMLAAAGLVDAHAAPVDVAIPSRMIVARRP